MVNLSKDHIKKIRQIELKARKMVRGLMGGDQITLQKGFGLEFDQLADYQFGDDIRFIDWKGSARAGKLLVKHYKEETNRTFILLVDVSASNLYGSKGQSKQQLIQEVVLSLALAGLYAKDAVGVIFFSSIIESYIPPRAGLKQLHTIWQCMQNIICEGKQTNIAEALQFLSKKINRESIICIVSDFIDQHYYEKHLRMIAYKHDVIALRCLDHNERMLPSVGYVHAMDIETQEPYIIDTRIKSSIIAWQRQQLIHTKKIFKQYGIDFLDVEPATPFLEKIILHMKYRA